MWQNYFRSYDQHFMLAAVANADSASGEKQGDYCLKQMMQLKKVLNVSKNVGAFLDDATAKNVSGSICLIKMKDEVVSRIAYFQVCLKL